MSKRYCFGRCILSKNLGDCSFHDKYKFYNGNASESAKVFYFLKYFLDWGNFENFKFGKTMIKMYEKYYSNKLFLLSFPKSFHCVKLNLASDNDILRILPNNLQRYLLVATCYWLLTILKLICKADTKILEINYSNTTKLLEHSEKFSRNFWFKLIWKYHKKIKPKMLPNMYKNKAFKNYFTIAKY